MSEHAPIQWTGLPDKFLRGADGADGICAEGHRRGVTLLNEQIGGIAFEGCEGEIALLNEIHKTKRSSNADLIASIQQAFAERDVGQHITACAAG